MKARILAPLVFFVSTIANAAPVVIDFEEVTPAYVIGSLTVASKGFNFALQPDSASPPESGVSAAGLTTGGDCFPYGGGCGGTIIMDAINGSPFAVLGIGAYTGSFSGTVSGGGIANLAAPIGTGDWLQLQTFVVDNSCPFTPCGYYFAALDDITVNVVPIPAAVWLFGSALAGLAGFRGYRRAGARL